MAYLKTIAEAGELLANREPFTTGTLSAKYDSAGNYLVFSYDTMVAGIGANGLKTINNTKYSQTTTRHTNLVRKAWGLN